MLDIAVETHRPYSTVDAFPLQGLYLEEMQSAVDWLLEIRQEQDGLVGWGWIQHIPPNEQNTAEVVHAILLSMHELPSSALQILYQSARSFLLHPREHGRISADYCWMLMALQVMEQRLDWFRPVCNTAVLKSDIDRAKAECVDWLRAQQNADGGWGDTQGSISLVSRTAMAVLALREVGGVERAIEWLLAQQNPDGGFGNRSASSTNAEQLHEQLRYFTSHEKLEYQHQSNAACTGLAMLALRYSHLSAARSAIRRAYQWLMTHQQPGGGWNVFQEVGVRDGKVYTWRYFSTAWALQALILTGCCHYDDMPVLDAVDYLLSLQDEYTRGWRTSQDTDPFTWATCNALVTLHHLRRDAAKMKSKNWVAILREWKELKRQRAIHTVKLFRRFYSFNMPVAIAFSTVSSLLCLAAVWIVCRDLVHVRWAHYVLTSVIVTLMGGPWIVATRFSDRNLNWIQSFSLVYGPIGVLLGLLLMLV
ncbi:MAG: terpene cyclase/mutase family protein [Alicyclobacillaceae bacterium]|nr:terpene cyclase/mutase family protein [Alicyclobacillaceae bacterium]